jgi:hypothetical protein
VGLAVSLFHCVLCDRGGKGHCNTDAKLSEIRLGKTMHGAQRCGEPMGCLGLARRPQDRGMVVPNNSRKIARCRQGQDRKSAKVTAFGRAMAMLVLGAAEVQAYRCHAA